MEDVVLKLFIDQEDSPGKEAMLLAMTETRESEEILKSYFKQKGHINVVTEVAGKSSDLTAKAVSSVVGAAIHTDLIQEEPREIHALVHATIEAFEGIMLGIPLSSNFRVKVALVRTAEWMTVGAYGSTAFHNLTNHPCCGLGVMHI